MLHYFEDLVIDNNKPLRNEFLYYWNVLGSSSEISVNGIYPTPWFDAWRETLMGCLEMTEHDFTRHYLASILVVSSSHPNPNDQFQQLNENLQQLIVNTKQYDFILFYYYIYKYTFAKRNYFYT